MKDLLDIHKEYSRGDIFRRLETIDVAQVAPDYLEREEQKLVSVISNHIKFQVYDLLLKTKSEGGISIKACCEHLNGALSQIEDQDFLAIILQNFFRYLVSTPLKDGVSLSLNPISLAKEGMVHEVHNEALPMDEFCRFLVYRIYTMDFRIRYHGATPTWAGTFRAFKYKYSPDISKRLLALVPNQDITAYLEERYNLDPQVGIDRNIPKRRVRKIDEKKKNRKKSMYGLSTDSVSVNHGIRPVYIYEDDKC